jgi:hypothetical protein
LLVLVAAACGRDLSVPQQPVPPHIDSISPAQGFAGDTITLTGSGLNDPAISVFFDVRAAAIVTPPTQRDSKTLQVSVPQDVLGTEVSVSTTQGTGKAAQPFTYLGLGHPRSVALRALVSLRPDVLLAFPLKGGVTALLDWRYGMVLQQQPDGSVSLPSRIGVKPFFAFGPASAAWVLDAPDNGPLSLVPVSLNDVQPTVGPGVLPVTGSAPGADASPSAARFAIPSGNSVSIYALPAGTRVSVPIPGATANVLAVRFAGENTLVGFTSNEPFRIELAGPVVSVGAAFAAVERPAAPFVETALDPKGGRLAYATFTQVRFLTWGAAGAPALTALAIDPKIFPHALTFNADGSRIFVGDEFRFVVAACDAGTGALLSAQAVPGLSSLALVPDGPNQGFLVAATGAGAALLFPSGQLLRTNAVGVSLHAAAVDPVCGDLLTATAFGPLQLPRSTLSPLALDATEQFQGLQASEGGIVGWSGNDLFVYLPPASCRGYGSFKLVASAARPSIGAALSANGKWVASSDGKLLELIPRSDNGAGLEKKTLDFGTGSVTPIRYAGDSLTVGHAVAAGGFAVSTYVKGTLQESATLPLNSVSVNLDRLRFAQAWIIGQQNLVSGDFVATDLTLWDENKGVLARSSVPATFTIPTGVSADGFMLVGVSTLGRDTGIDTLILQLLGSRLIQEPGPHLDLPGLPAQVLASADGGRFYASLPDQSVIAVIE